MAICHNIFVNLSLFPYQKGTRMLLVVLTIFHLLYLQILVKFLSHSSFLSMRIVSWVPHCNLVSNHASLPLCVPVQSKMLFPDILMGRLSSVASLMHLILLTFSWKEVVVRFLRFWYSRQQLCVHWNWSLSVPFSVSNGVRQGHLFCFRYNYVDGCCWNWVRVVLAVFGVLFLLVRFATQTTLRC